MHEKRAATDAELISSELELRRYEDAKIKHENEKLLAPIRIEQVEKRKLTHQTDLQLANLDMERTEVRPQFSGVISEVMAEQGQFLRVGEPILRLTDITDVEIPLPLTLPNLV
ncbi:MAG: hypothetical protein IH805_08390, partial [Proteobacteria bacterium]|nr:hypothetical protein [Pseudomonadota bacterium]